MHIPVTSGCVAVVAILLTLLAGTVVLRNNRGVDSAAAPFVHLELATQLTTRRAAMLSPAQINGTAPLTVGGSPLQRAIMLRDVVLSLRHDIDALGAVGMCAHHYDFPVSACMMRRLGPDEYVVLYNLNITGWRPAKLINWETSTLCSHQVAADPTKPRAPLRFQVERFEAVWIRYVDEHGHVYDRHVDDTAQSRTLQHLAALNIGVLPCDKFTIEELMRMLRHLATYQTLP